MGIAFIIQMILTSWIFRKLSQIDAKNRLIHNQNRLTLPKYFKLVGLAGLFFWTLLIVLMNIASHSKDKWALLIFVPLALLSGLILWLYAVQRHQFDDKGLDYTTMWNQRKRFLWRDIVAVDYSATWQYFAFQTRSGDKFYIVPNMLGLADFLAMLLANAPKSALGRWHEIFQKWLDERE